MKRETISLALNGLDDRYISESAVFSPVRTQAAPERIGQMRKKRIITLALAAALLLALGITSYAVWSVHAARQQELKADLRIEESKVKSYVEYEVPDTPDGTGLTLLSTVNDGDSQRVFVNVSPVERDVLDRFPESVSFAWKLDGMTVNGEPYWMVASPKLQSDISVSGHEAIHDAILRDAYDEGAKTLTLELFIANNAIEQAQAHENSENVHLTLTLWDHQAQAEAHVSSSAEWLDGQTSFGSVWFTPTAYEMRYFDFGQALYHDEALDKTIEIVGLELTPFSAVWKLRYDGAAAFHRPDADWDAFRDWSLLEDKVCIEAALIFSDGSRFSTGGALTTPYVDGVVEQHCGWGAAIDINDVQRIVLGDLVLWEAP